MTFNVGGIDRALRVIFGVSIISWGLITGSLWGLVGLVLLVTGISRWCPLYLPFGVSTCKPIEHERII